MTVDGTLIGTLIGTPQPQDMTYDQLGTGFTNGWPDAAPDFDPFVGTINSVQISTSSVLNGAFTFPGTSGAQAVFAPPGAGSETIDVLATNPDGSTGVTNATLNVTAVPPIPVINGLPDRVVNPGTPVTLTATATDASPVDTAAGFSYLWQATDSNGNSITGSGALSFNGTSQFVDLGNPMDLNISGQITLDAWILPESTSGLQDIMAHGYQTYPNDAEDFLRIDNGYYQVGSWNGNNAFAQVAIPAGDIGQWVNLAGVYNGSEWILYRDGVQVATSGSTSQGALPVSNTDWAIGAAGTGNQRFFDGEIDDVSIWNVGLSAATVRSAMVAAPTAIDSGLVAYYPFDETSGNLAIDATGNNNGTLGGISPNNPAAEPSRVAGIVLSAGPSSGGGLSFNGTSQYVDLGDPMDLNISGQITLDAWILPESTSGLQDIIAHGYETSPSDAEDFLRINNGYYQVGSWNGNTAMAQVAIPAGDIGQWVNLAGVYDGTQWLLYRDGVQVATSGPTTQGAVQVNPSPGFGNGGFGGSGGTTHPGSSDWAIGARGTGTERFFQGDITEVSIWDVGLSATGVEAALVAAPTVPQSGLVAYYPLNATSGNTAIDDSGDGNNGTLGGINPNNPAADPSWVGGSVTSPSVTLTPDDSQSDTVTLEAFDAAGESGVVTGTFPSSPVRITVNASGNLVVQQGTPFTGSGSFTDLPGDGPWTAWVNYGDGTGNEALTLTGTSFMLMHIYENAGTFATTVTVTNSIGVSGSYSFNVTVSGFTVNDGNPQQSMVTSLTYTFNNPTQVEPGAFELLRNGKPSKINLKVTPQPDGQTYLITFSGPGVVGGSVPDGHYTLITLADKVNVLSGPPMTANDVNTFVRLFGDVEGDGKLNAFDLALLKQAEDNPNSPETAYFEYDGKPGIDKTDIAQFDKRYKGKVDPPRRAPAKFAGRTVHHHGTVRPASSRQHPGIRVAIQSPDTAEPVAIVPAAPGRSHRR